MENITKKIVASILSIGILFTGIANVQAAKGNAYGHDKDKAQGNAYGHDKDKAQGNAYGHDKGKAQGKAVGHHKSEAVVEEPVTPETEAQVKEAGVQIGDIIYFRELREPYYPMPYWQYIFIGDAGSIDGRMELRTGEYYIVGKDITITEAERMLARPQYNEDGVLELVDEIPAGAKPNDQAGILEGDKIVFKSWDGLQPWELSGHVFHFKKDDGTYMDLQVGRNLYVGTEITVAEAERLIGYTTWTFEEVMGEWGTK
ncbi:hypothetical protein R4Z10_08240 [Niallia sp. XMNu-256]|uniref:hypothetical protein n=1 Tax=Niallia sp. XMNu-256 TaxID=3082444 RepID=UPI0030CAEFC0